MEDVDIDGTDLPEAALKGLLEVDPTKAQADLDAAAEFLETFGEKLPEAVREQLAAARERLG